MDIAVSTILLLYFLLPGLIFRRFYYTEEFSKEYFKESVTTLLVATIIPSTLLHLLCWQFVPRKYVLNTDVLSILLNGSDDLREIKAVWNQVYAHMGEILKYFGLLVLISGIFGWLAKLLVRKTKLDRKVKLFRFQNEWHYIFSGEILDFPRVPGRQESIDFTFIDLLVETDEGTVIYTGILADYNLSKDGGIDTICLTEASRRYLKDDGQGDKAYYDLPGAFFIIPYEKVLNIHLTYYSVDDEEENVADNGQPKSQPVKITTPPTN